MKVVAAARRGEPSVARLICRRTRQQHGRWPPLPPSPAPPPPSSLPRRPWRAAMRLSLSQGQRGNLCAAKATVGGGWTYGGGGGWLSGGGEGEGEGEVSLGMERGRWCAASDSCRTLSSAWTKEAHNNKILPENVSTLSCQHETKEKVFSYSDASEVLRYAFTMTEAAIDHEYER
ncbi:uncharacterized protein LOC127766637 [Oryza glaberrima]|uniref:uncharacterized protein LOC127766637 n=1 Tax=Oryza glaberrima TaxID=4538 RepID=UPI00224C2106|nr:uncharacterized protein LOC127766637 [Oryza glaberrima]